MWRHPRNGFGRNLISRSRSSARGLSLRSTFFAGDEPHFYSVELAHVILYPDVSCVPYALGGGVHVVKGSFAWEVAVGCGHGPLIWIITSLISQPGLGVLGSHRAINNRTHTIFGNTREAPVLPDVTGIPAAPRGWGQGRASIKAARAHQVFKQVEEPEQEREPQLFWEGIQKAPRLLKVSGRRSIELVAYQVQDVANSWYRLCESKHPKDAPPVTLDDNTERSMEWFLSADNERIIPQSLRIIGKEIMGMPEYSMQFTRLAKYASHLVSYERAKV
ncbi:hypothetical protein KY290_010224 [Solanum tuberosum]|uniref:Uncharacterized protein n=1 Tax=Solanum tuberosum TaxID=4113 RepID=A0ABQ7VZW4_SOLTU|nr:hypothetical protein KY290_010224 [Solanum tuberosum]